MNKKTYYDMGVIDSVSRCLRLSREWSKKRDECLASGDMQGAREANGKLDACISCAEEITKMLESNLMIDTLVGRSQKIGVND